MLNRIRWFPLLFFLLLLGWVFKEPTLVALPAGLIVVFGIAMWWRNRSLDGVTYRRHFHFTRAFPGEKVNITSLKSRIENSYH